MLKTPRIYLDNNATTRPDQSMIDDFCELMKSVDATLWGNPSSVHFDSRGSKSLLRESRRLFSDYLGCSPLEIIYNSGASEGNNTVLKSVWQTFGLSKNEYIISSVEHPSVVKTAQYLETLGARVHWVPVNKDGFIDLTFIKNHINEKTALVSIMFANNETGTLFPIKEIADIVHASRSLLHVDCVQALGKYDLQFSELNIDYATFSAHKFYAFKGFGVLYVKKGRPYLNLVHGGGQERGRRGGTENTIGLWSFYQSLSKLSEIKNQVSRLEKLRHHFETEITSRASQVYITAGTAPRVCNTSSLIIDGVDGETLLMSLDLKGFAVSTGAACSSGNPEPSPVLLAMGLTRGQAQNSLRISLGWSTTEDEVNQFVSVLLSEIKRLREISSNEVLL